MRFILCYDSALNILNARTKERKGLVTYYTTYGITTLKKHVNPNYSIIVKFFEEETNNEILKTVERQLAKKRPNVPISAIFVIFIVKKPFKKANVQKKTLLDLGLLIVKNNLPLQFVEIPKFILATNQP
jgi:hypothetical protein